MRSGPLVEKLPLKEVDFGVAFDHECHQYAYGKGNSTVTYNNFPVFYINTLSFAELARELNFRQQLQLSTTENLNSFRR
jgi:hypothetical protein